MKIQDPLALLAAGLEQSYAAGFAAKSFPAWSAAAAWAMAHFQWRGQTERWKSMAVLMTATLGYPDHDAIVDQLVPADRALVEAVDLTTAEWPAPAEAEGGGGEVTPGARAAAVAAIDREAEETRSAFVTGGAGKVGTYELKREFAAEAVAGSQAAIDLFAAEAAARGMTALELAQLVETKAQEWVDIAFQIDAAAAEAKVAIEAAQDSAAIGAAIDTCRMALATLRQAA